MPTCTDPSTLDSMLRGYAVAALWSSPYRTESKGAGESENAPEFMDGEFGVIDIDAETLAEMGAECKAFAAAHAADIGDADGEQVGHDLWMSRNGHGCGFFDKAHIYGEAQAERLQEAARKLRERNLWGSHGKVFME